MVEAQLGAGVDVRGSAGALHQREDRLVDERAEHAVHQEAWHVLGLDHRLAQVLGELPGGGVGGVIGLQAADDLDQAHHRHGREEMEADELLRPIRGGRQASDADAARVAGEDGTRVGFGADLGPGLALERLVLEDGLDDQLVASHAIGPDGGRHAAGDLIGGRLVELPLVNLAGQVAGDPRLALVGQLRRAVGQRHLLAGGRAHLGDAVAHQAGADDVDAVDAHGRLA